jgi:Kef-type K+ transport system membrane component KefB
MDPVLQFTVLVLAALLAQLTVERAHLPGLLGLLVLGMMLGPGGFEVMPREPLVDLLGHIGLVYVMFLAGMEIDLDIARDHLRETMAFGLLAFLFSLLPGMAVGRLLDLDWPAAVLLGALVSSHTLLAYPVVEKLGIVDRIPVIVTIGGTLVTDTLALALLAVVMSVATAEVGLIGSVAPIGLLILLAAAAIGGLPRLSRAFFRQPRVSRAEKALYVLVVLLVVASLADVIGTHAVLGAFIAGVALNRPLVRHDDLREHIEFVGRMLFIPFFFVYTGMLLALESMGDPGVLLRAGLLLALVVGGKGAAAWLTGARYRYAPRDRLLMVGLTIPQAAATLAVTITAAEAGLLPGTIVDAVVLLIFVTCLAGPLLTSYTGKRVRDAPPRTDDRHPGADEPLQREL